MDGTQAANVRMWAWDMAYRHAESVGGNIVVVAKNADKIAGWALGGKVPFQNEGQA